MKVIWSTELVLGHMLWITEHWIVLIKFHLGQYCSTDGSQKLSGALIPYDQRIIENLNDFLHTELQIRVCVIVNNTTTWVKICFNFENKILRYTYFHLFSSPGTKCQGELLG